MHKNADPSETEDLLFGAVGKMILFHESPAEVVKGLKADGVPLEDIAAQTMNLLEAAVNMASAVVGGEAQELWHAICQARLQTAAA